MKRIISAVCLTTLFAVMALPAWASPITFTGSSGNLAASVQFDVSGSNLLVTLTNTATVEAGAPGAMLTGVFFNIPSNPLLTKTSAMLPGGAFVNNDQGGASHTPVAGPLPTNGPNVGGEWGYLNGFSLGGANEGIASAGYLGGGATRFRTDSNLEGPPSGSLDGVQYGITTSNYVNGHGNGGVSSSGLINNSVVFTLGGLPQGFVLGDISHVSFQYGTDFNETNIPGIRDPRTPPSEVPEPSTLALFGIGLVSLSLFARRNKKQG